MLILAVLLVVQLTVAQDFYSHRGVSNDTSSEVQLEYVLLNENNPCNRKCIKGAPPMVCRFNFKVEWYTTLSKACYDCPYNYEDCFRLDCIPADGYQRPVLIVNRKMPGEAIEVCQGDQLIVDVMNMLPSETTSVHWHGLHQRKNPYMDGVPYISQCPIMPMSTFRYEFPADQSGTHFWHSHSGVQRADGAYGSLIVRQPAEDDPHSSLYDHDLSEHVVVLIDWDSSIATKTFVSHHHSSGDNKPATLLINGYGFPLNTPEWHIIGQQLNITERFYVEQGQRYRFRIINAGFLNCPIEMSIDNHTITVISSDGSDFKPIEATSLVSYAGERFDIVLNANQPEGLYWIRFRGLMDCDERFTRAHQVAVLHYKGANATVLKYPDGDPNYENAHNEGVQVNSLNKGTEENITAYVAVPHFESLKGWDESLSNKPDYQFYVAYDFYKLNNPHFYKVPEYGFYNVSVPNRVLSPQINHISMKFPNSALMSQRDQFNDSMFCNSSTVANCEKEFCECTHVLQASLGSIVEMILVDEGFAYDANHPLHLHGYGFRVVAMERLGKNTTVAEVKERDRKGLIKRNLLTPPLKDTVTVPDGGYTIIRFKADNPGYWLFHCHIEFHVELGMALVLKVGEHKDMAPVPNHFPRCGDYLASAEPIQPEPPCKSAASPTKFAFSNLILFILALFRCLIKI